MQYVITAGSELPIYRQVMRQITDAIAGGRLRPGDKLTSQRELAEQLVISPLTVKKAYDELERQGLIHTQRGKGTFVTVSAAPLNPSEQRERLRDPARRLVSRAHLTGVPLSEVVDLLHELDEEFDAERQAREEESDD